MSDHERAESPKMALAVNEGAVVPPASEEAPDEIPPVSRTSSRLSCPASAASQSASAVPRSL